MVKLPCSQVENKSETIQSMVFVILKTSQKTRRSGIISTLTSNITFLSSETVPIKKKDMIENSQISVYLNILDS